VTLDARPRIVGVVVPRAKAAVVFLVVLAVLYVLISPLPEIAATCSGRCFVLVVALLFMMISLGCPFPSLLFGKPSELALVLDRTLLCSRLC
jgi:hypothetical protein